LGNTSSSRTAGSVAVWLRLGSDKADLRRQQGWLGAGLLVSLGQQLPRWPTPAGRTGGGAGAGPRRS